LTSLTARLASLLVRVVGGSQPPPPHVPAIPPPPRVPSFDESPPKKRERPLPPPLPRDTPTPTAPYGTIGDTLPSPPPVAYNVDADEL
jgi:hypothetical protein